MTDQEATGAPDPEWLALIEAGERGGGAGAGAVCAAYSRGLLQGVERAAKARPARPESLDQKEIGVAVDVFVGAYNASRSDHLGYAYVSPSLLVSDQHLADAVGVLLRPLLVERDRYLAHSKTLNAVSWAMAEALGDVPPGAFSVQGDPMEQVKRLIGTLERRTAQLEAIDQELREFGIEHPLGRAGVADVCAMAAGRLVELEQVRAERDAARADADAARARIAELEQLL